MVEQARNDSGSTSARGAFVGREREMAELAAAFERTAAGHGRVVLLAGEPGIGKTRIAHEFAEIAAWRGARVAWGRCYEGGGAPPYWPWTQVLRELIRDHSAADLSEKLGTGFAHIVELMPELQDQSAPLPPPTLLENPESTRFRLFDSVAGLLKIAAEATPVLVVLDDIQWADESSLRTLEYVAQQISACRLQVIGTYRHTDLQQRHPLFRTLGGLNGVEGFVRLQLAGISQANVADYIRLSAGIDPPEAISRAVHAQTEGNPLFLTETVRLLLQEGALSRESISARPDWSIQIPDGVRDVLNRRLERLSTPCRQVLEVASVIGRRFEADELSRVVQASDADPRWPSDLAALLDILDEAVGAYVLERLAPTGQYQFTHSLIREALYTQLPTGRRARLHARIADVLETAGAGSLSLNRVIELANHYALAQPVGSREKLIRYSMLAGERALAALAPDEAAQIFERGLELVRGKNAETDTVHLSLGAGRAYAQSMKGARAIELVETAFQIFLDHKQIDSAISAAQTRLDLVTTPLDRSARLVARGLVLALKGSREEALLRIRDARVGSARGLDFKAAAASADRAVEIARRLGDVHLEMDALVTSATIATGYGNWQASIARSEEVLAKARDLDETGVKSAAHFNIGSALLELGKPELARPHIAAAVEEADRGRSRMELLSAFPLAILEAGLRGAWDEARAAHQRPLELWPRDPRHLLARAWVEYQVGDIEAGDRFLEPAFEASGGPVGSSWPALLFWPHYAQIAGRTDRLERAADSAREMLSGLHGQALFTWLARACLATVGVATGDRSIVSEQYPALKAREGCLLLMTVSMDRLLGNLAQAMHEPETATRHYEDALKWTRQAGYQPELAWTCHDYAEMLLNRSGGPDQARVDKLIQEAEAIASRLGMRPLSGRMDALRQLTTRPRGTTGLP